MASINRDIHLILKKIWGYDSFRPLQEDIINSVLDGYDTLGLMPTGGGKSITFQVPGLCYESGLTIVVTPLISLMKDQIDNLKRRHIKAVALHSGMNTKENRIAWEHLTKGNARFLYVSPERLQNERFLMELRSLKVNMITVDEAHCISQWGYDFRPSYLNIRKLRKIKPDIPVLALTATATPEVAWDIMTNLDFKQKNLFRKSFTRRNISYLVRHSDTKIHETLRILSKTEGTAIVYVRSRKKTREIADYLTSCGIPATFYHAGLDNNVKTERQNAWKDGSVRVMVATNAFGMGIDKPDVRVVIHYDLAPTLEEYYQEAGRAGRDGLPSYAVLLTSKSDKALLRRRVTEAFPDRKVVKNIYEQICNNLHISVGEGYEMIREFNITRFCDLFGLQEKQTRASLLLLGQAGYMHFIEDADKYSRLRIIPDREELYHEKFINHDTERVLQAALRLYTGLFTDFVYISEPEIAYALKMSQNDVYDALLELERMKIVNYIPRSGLPMIYLPTAREEQRSLIIPISIYEERRKVMEQRTEAVIDYAFNHGSCRVKRMLAYFGEKDACDCGSCDHCREKKLRGDNRADKSSTIGIILRFLEQHPSGARFLSIEAHCGPDKREIARCLSFLCSEGHVKFNDNLYFLS